MAESDAPTGASDPAAAERTEVVVNGEPRRVAPGTSIADLIRGLELRPDVVAVELNRRIVRRDEHTTTVLAPGDRVEVVTLVGGG